MAADPEEIIMQLSPLAVSDPLTDKTVIINIQVNADHKNRESRSVLVTAGISGQVPIMLSGRYGQLNKLIEQAWREFGKDQKEPTSANDCTRTTIAKVSVKPAKKPIYLSYQSEIHLAPIFVH